MPYRIFAGSKKNGIWHVVFAWTHPENIIIHESNYWAYILPFASCAVAQAKINETFDKIKTNQAVERIDSPCVFGVSPFYSGTAHGYCFIFQLLDQFRNSNKKILLIETAQKGMFDLCEKVFGNERIIRIKSDKIYEIPDLTFVDAKYNTTVPQNLMDRIMPIFIQPAESLSLCILKTATTENTTKNGILSQSQIDNLQIPKRFTMIDPSRYNECDYASMLYHSKEILISWGTASFKGAAYLIKGNACKKLTVLVIGKQFEREYSGNNNTLKNVADVPQIDYYVWNETLVLKDI